MVSKSLLATLVWLLVWTTSSTATSEPVCAGAVQLDSGAEDAAMLQTGQKAPMHLLEVSGTRTTVADICEDSEFIGQFQNDHDHSCGNNSAASTCTLDQLADNTIGCWSIPVNCATVGQKANNQYYTHKYCEGGGGHIGSVVTVTPPEYVCITATCVSVTQMGEGEEEGEAEIVKDGLLLGQTQGLADDETEILKNGDGKRVCTTYNLQGGESVQIATANGALIGSVKIRYRCCPQDEPSTSSSSSSSSPSPSSTSSSFQPFFEDPPATTTTTTTTSSLEPVFEVSTSTADSGGDPHINTFDKQHYLLLKQGTFLLWSFSGSNAEVHSFTQKSRKLPVDFQIYAHYSGHTSYTKGLMLVDNSGGYLNRVLELTSEDCTWRTTQRFGDFQAWSNVDEPQLLSVPDANGEEMTAFRMRQSDLDPKMYVELLMRRADPSFKKVANLYVRCRPGHHINTKIAMTSKEDMDLVGGQVGSHGHTEAGEDHSSPNFLQGMHERMRSDKEFATSKSWRDLGGSEAAASYLNEVDEEKPVLKTCSGEEKLAAIVMCKKYLGAPPSKDQQFQSFENHFQGCVFDVCNGGGEVAAELAAEIMEA